MKTASTAQSPGTREAKLPARVFIHVYDPLNGSFVRGWFPVEQAKRVALFQLELAEELERNPPEPDYQI